MSKGSMNLLNFFEKPPTEVQFRSWVIGVTNCLRFTKEESNKKSAEIIEKADSLDVPGRNAINRAKELLSHKL